MFNPHHLIAPHIFRELVEIALKHTKNERQTTKIWHWEIQNSHKNFCRIFAIFSQEAKQKIFLEASPSLKISLKLRANFVNNF